uniref:MYXO-CTERM sorting domain-containing protein n=1 Tax=Xanthomonas campestris TaxID=339 RepID=UPI0035B534C2
MHGLVARCAGLHTAPFLPWAGWGKGRLRRRRRSGLLVTNIPPAPAGSVTT